MTILLAGLATSILFTIKVLVDQEISWIWVFTPLWLPLIFKVSAEVT